jgi:6,7-dimethyl-8-ribityllumazine synthase
MAQRKRIVPRPAPADSAGSERTFEGTLDARGLRFALVVSRFNDFVSNRLLSGAEDCLRRHGAEPGSLAVVRVPGSWEIPLAADRLARTGRYDAVVALGVLVRGETPHFDVLAAEVSRGLARVSMDTGVPIGFGVLTTETVEQAVERAGAKAGNKGWDAALSAMEMANLLRRMA